jgi:broad-specificity NMP kinase
MALVLLSGRPGAGKTAFGSWLAVQRGFVHIETDAEWSKWGSLVCVQSLEAAVATRNLARALGPATSFEMVYEMATSRPIPI